MNNRVNFNGMLSINLQETKSNLILRKLQIQLYLINFYVKVSNKTFQKTSVSKITIIPKEI